MPSEAPTAPPPAAPPAPQMPSQVRAPVPVPEIKASEFIGGPTAPPKPGSARDSMYKALRKKAGMVDDPTPVAPKPTGDQPAPADPTESGADPAAPPDSPPSEPADAPAAPAGDKKKVSPWKLVDQYKSRVSELEKEVAEFKTTGLSKEKFEEVQKQHTELEAKAKALEDEIRFVNYSKSDEFQTKYQKPYEAAWNRAMSDLKELTVEDPSTQQRRAVNAEDLLSLVNMPLGQARDIADTMFGKFADDVMGHRKEIRRLFEEQAAALDEAKKNGATREKQRQEQWQKLNGDITKNVVETWKQANQQLATDTKYGHYFQPVEGDTEGNQRLAKGFELVDRAFGENPNDPRLSPEQRASIVKRHAAVRNRAAAFGRLAAKNDTLTKENAALKKQLEQLQASEPPTTAGQRSTSPANGGHSTARDDVMGALRKLAR